MKKKILLTVLIIILLMWSIGYTIYTTNLRTAFGFGWKTTFEIDQGYILGASIEKINYLDAQLIGFEVIDEDGYSYKDNELPFQWLVWILPDDKKIGIEFADKPYEIYEAKANVKGYVLHNNNDIIHIAKYLKRVRPSEYERNYFLKLHYKVWGVDKYLVLDFVTM